MTSHRVSSSQGFKGSSNGKYFYFANAKSSIWAGELFGDACVMIIWGYKLCYCLLTTADWHNPSFICCIRDFSSFPQKRFEILCPSNFSLPICTEPGTRGWDPNQACNLHIKKFRLMLPQSHLWLPPLSLLALTILCQSREEPHIWDLLPYFSISLFDWNR